MRQVLQQTPMRELLALVSVQTHYGDRWDEYEIRTEKPASPDKTFWKHKHTHSLINR